MKIIKKYLRLSLIVLLPLLLGAREGGCYPHSIYNECRSSLRFNKVVKSSTYKYGITNNGIIAITENIWTSCPDIIKFIVPGGPSLNDIIGATDKMIVVGDGGTIVRFDLLNYDIINSPTTSNLVSIKVSEQNLWATGNDGIILRSTDNGLAWELVNFPELIGLNDVYIDSYLPSFVQVVGEDLSLYLTFNGGVTWQHIPLGGGLDKRSGTLPTLNRIYHIDGLNAYLMGDSGTVIKTTDNFSTFTFVDLQTIENLNDVYFISADSGFIVGANGTIRFTTNSGIDWFEDPDVTALFEGKNIKRISSFNNNIGAIIADSGLTFTVARDSSAFLTDLEGGQLVITEYSLSQNYPNPFNPSTKINYSVPQFGLVTIKVYDLLGKEVATLANEEKNAGNYQVDFSGAELPSGVYFYKLTAGNFTETKKLVLMK